MKKNSLKLMSILLIAVFALVGCGKGKTEEAANPMQYVAPEEIKKVVEEGSDDYLVLDVRKVEDYNTSHIKGSQTADVDAANKGGDDAAGTESLKKGLTEATGNETGKEGQKIALVCYSGKSYAQKATDLMIEMGINKDDIYTLEGGMEAWEAGGDDYKGLLE